MRFIEDRAVPDATGLTWLTAASRVFEQAVAGVAQRALATLVAEHARFASAGPCDGAPLLAAAETVRDAMRPWSWSTRSATARSTSPTRACGDPATGGHHRCRPAQRDLRRRHPRPSGIGDIVICLENGDIDNAQRLRRRFTADPRLLDDLGWFPTDERQTFTLTIKPRRLDLLLGQLAAIRAARLADAYPRSKRKQRAEAN